MLKKCLGLVIGLALASALPALADYPERDIQGVIQWGAGGSTDGISRAVTPNVEPVLGKQIVLVNKPGGTGAIATQYVFSRRSDGYTLLFGAENPQLYGVLGLSPLSYKDFYPINILARGVVLIVANPDKPWNSIKDLVEDAQQHPGQIKMGSTGKGGVPFVVGSLMKTVTGFDVTSVPFEGDGPGLTALLGGHIDFMPAVYTACREHIKAGRLKVLAVVSDEPVPGIDYPLITQDYPAFKPYLPWGPFFGVFCKNDVPAEVKQKLTEAFKQGAESGKFKEFVDNFGAIPVNISGAEAEKFLSHWQSVTAWLLQDAGAAKVSPAELGIPRP